MPVEKFCVGDKRKYAHPKGVGLTPVIFLSEYGVVKVDDFSEESINSRLYGEHFAITEGWKGLRCLVAG